MSLFHSIQESFALLHKDRLIRQFAKRKKLTIYGAQSINAQIAPYGRPTSDYDIATRSPRKTARQLSQLLNRQAGGDYFFDQPSKVTKGVEKVYYKGYDLKPNTPDDLHLADFVKVKIPYVKIGGLRFAPVSKTIADKKKALADKAYAFRHAKDQDDLNRIRLSQE